MRSGGHAFLEWLDRQLDGDVVQMTNIPDGFMLQDMRKRVFNYQNPRRRPKFKDNGYWHEWVWDQIGNMQSRKIDWFVYSYEDKPLDRISDEVKSFHSHRVLLLRDPYNMIASRLEGFQGNLHIRDPRATKIDVLSHWKRQAQEAMKPDSLFWTVLYNRWHVDPQYREAIAARIGVPFFDEGKETVPSAGGGSSFDRMTLNGHASKMNVLSRWPAYLQKSSYVDLFDDETIELSDHLFPELRHVGQELKKMRKKSTN